MFDEYQTLKYLPFLPGRIVVSVLHQYFEVQNSGIVEIPHCYNTIFTTIDEQQIITIVIYRDCTIRLQKKHVSGDGPTINQQYNITDFRSKFHRLLEVDSAFFASHPWLADNEPGKPFGLQ